MNKWDSPYKIYLFAGFFSHTEERTATYKSLSEKVAAMAKTVEDQANERTQVESGATQRVDDLSDRFDTLQDKMDASEEVFTLMGLLKLKDSESMRNDVDDLEKIQSKRSKFSPIFQLILD